MGVGKEERGVTQRKGGDGQATCRCMSSAQSRRSTASATASRDETSRRHAATLDDGCGSMCCGYVGRITDAYLTAWMCPFACASGARACVRVCVRERMYTRGAAHRTADGAASRIRVSVPPIRRQASSNSAADGCPIQDNTCLRVRVCLHACTYLCGCVRACARMHAYMYMCVCARNRTYLQARTRARALA